MAENDPIGPARLRAWLAAPNGAERRRVLSSHTGRTPQTIYNWCVRQSRPTLYARTMLAALLCDPELATPEAWGGETDVTRVPDATALRCAADDGRRLTGAT